MSSNPEAERDNARQAEIDRERAAKVRAALDQKEAVAHRKVRIERELADEIKRLKSYYEREAQRLDLHRRDLSAVFTTDVDNPVERLEDLTRQERQRVGDSFGAAVGELNRGIRDARDARWRVLDDQYYAIRHMPTSQASMTPAPKHRMKLEIKGWAHGEILKSNDVWFQLAPPLEGWVHSGEFRPEDRNVGNLPEVTIMWGDAYQHPATCICDTCLPVGVRSVTKGDVTIERVREQNAFAFELERTFQPALSYADRYEAKLRKEVAQKHAATRIPKGAKLLPPETEEQREALRQVERNRQAKMGYWIGPHPWLPGWRVLVDRHDGRRHEFWRPTKASAEKTGHKALARFVAKRQRAFEAANPRLVTAKDRWIIEPTQAEQTAKEYAEWDAQFNEEGKQ